MIQHIRLIKWKPGTTEEQIHAAFDEAGRLPKGIGVVEHVTLGRNRGDTAHGFTHAIIVQLSREDALAHYLEHPVRRGYVEEVLGPLEEQHIEVDIPVDAAVRRDPARNWEWGATAGMGALPEE